jgi:hypothetical protein
MAADERKFLCGHEDLACDWLTLHRWYRITPIICGLYRNRSFGNLHEPCHHNPYALLSSETRSVSERGSTVPVVYGAG